MTIELTKGLNIVTKQHHTLLKLKPISTFTIH